MNWNEKKAAKLRRLHKKVMAGKATRKETLEAFDQQRARKAALEGRR